MLFISIAFTLFALVAGMLLLAKAKKDELGKSYTWVSYLVITISLLMLICLGIRGVMRMTCGNNCSPSESRMCGTGMMNSECDRGGCMMMRRGGMNRHGRHMEEMEMCKTKNDSDDCCRGRKMKMHGCEPDDEHEKPDSLKK